MKQTTSKKSNTRSQTASKKSNNMVQTASKKSDTMEKTKATKKSILGIDLGSTALRAALVECEAPHHRHPVQNSDVDSIREVGGPMSAMGDFPVACCPLHETDPFAKIGAEALSEPGHISAKYLMYFLAKIKPEDMADYPLPQDLMTYHNDETFLEDCKEILARLLQGLKERVDAVAQRRGLFFEEIVLTIPAQWDTPFENAYEKIVEDVFAYTNEKNEKIKPKINFCGEADALARYVIIHEVQELQDWDVVLFLDFGGHSMSFYLTELKRTGTTDEAGKPNMTFFELDAGGCAGGAEMWSHRVGQLISAKLSETDEEDVIEEKKNKLLANFNKDKFGVIKRIQEGQTGVENIHYSDEQGGFTHIQLQREDIKKCFDAALAKPVTMAREQLKKLNGYRHYKKIGVIVAGGTLVSRRARKLVFDGTDIKPEEIKYTFDVDVTWLSSCNCIGAASAYAQRMKVAQFFEHGAIIALQQEKKGPGDDSHWDGFAYVLVGHTKKYVATVYNRTPDAKFKLVCNPNYAQNEQDNGNEARTAAGNNNSDTPITNAQTPIEECYDLWHLGPQPGGKLWIEASLTSTSGSASSEMTIHVSISRRNGERTRTIKDIYLPLFLDPGHNAVHIDPEAISKEENKQQAIWRGEKPNPEEPEPHSPQQGSEDGPSDSKKSSTAKKRKRKETSDAPSTEPNKRHRTRANNPDNEEHQSLPNYDMVPRPKRKATAPAATTQRPKRRRTDAAQSGEQTAEQPEEQAQAQEAPQQDEEDMNVLHDDQPENSELDQTQQEPAATASSSHTQPQPTQQPSSPERSSSNNNNKNVNGKTSRSTRTRNRNRTAANTREATATTTVSTDSPTTAANQSAGPFVNASFRKMTSSPKGQRSRTEPSTEQQQAGQSQSQPTQTQTQAQTETRRSGRQKKAKAPAVASSTTPHPQQQAQQPQQQQEQAPQPQSQVQPEPRRPTRQEKGKSRAVASSTTQAQQPQTQHQQQEQAPQSQTQAEPEPRRPTRQEKGKAKAVASSSAAATQQPQPQPQQQQAQQPQAQQQQQAQQPQTQPQQEGQQNPQARPRPPIRVELGPANRPPPPPKKANSQAGPSQSQTQPQAQSSQPPAPTRQPAPPSASQAGPSRARARHARQSNGPVQDSIVVSTDGERVIPASPEKEDKGKGKSKKDEDPEESEDDDLDNGNNGDYGDDGDDDDGGDDDPNQGDGGGEGITGGVSPELGEATPVRPPLPSLAPLGDVQVPSSSQQNQQQNQQENQEQSQQQQAQQQQKKQQGESSASGAAPGLNRRNRARARRQQRAENEANEAVEESTVVDGEVIIRRNPLPSSRHQTQTQRQTRASAAAAASSSRAAQGQQQQQAGSSTAPVSSSRVSAAERNKENEREQMVGDVAETAEPARRRPTAAEKGKGKAVDDETGNGEPAPRRRPTRDEKGKGKAVDDNPKPAPAPAPKPKPKSKLPATVPPRAFYGPGPSSAAASSAAASSSAVATSSSASGSSSAPTPAQPKPKLNGKGKGNAQTAAGPATTTTTTAGTTTTNPVPSSLASQFRLLRPRSPPPSYPRPAVNLAGLLAGGRPSDLDALLAATAATPGRSPGQPTPRQNPPSTPAQPSPVRSADNGDTGTGNPVPEPGYAPASSSGQNQDVSGPRSEDGRDESGDGRGRNSSGRDSVEEGSRVSRTGRRSVGRGNVHPYRRIARESPPPARTPAASRPAAADVRLTRGSVAAANANANAASSAVSAARSSPAASSSPAGKKRARDDDEDSRGESSSTRSYVSAQEQEDEEDEDDGPSPPKRQRTESSSSGSGSNGSNGSIGNGSEGGGSNASDNNGGSSNGGGSSDRRSSDGSNNGGTDNNSNGNGSNLGGSPQISFDFEDLAPEMPYLPPDDEDDE
ncbi:hypothetical protein B0T20DRAFT_505497 [Sordaria brevicollis]|uniref:Uncharacterized protein n=1 Tax=Sordaria brevicollis TaxID=83679 RepID=A0AAE0UEL6_SORBR|nr:hypothetical protein B0T20DRAFT_505497 [Sordaria brevicollis]